MASSNTISNAENPGDKLWQLQIRRENKAILQQLQESEKKKDAAFAENEKKLKSAETRLVALEAKLKEVEQDQQKRDQASEKTRMEHGVKIEELKQQLYAFLKSRNEFSKGKLALWPVTTYHCLHVVTTEQIKEIIPGIVPSNNSNNRGSPTAGPGDNSQGISIGSSVRRPKGIISSRSSDEDIQLHEAPQSSRQGTTGKSIDATLVRRPNTRSRSQADEHPAVPVPAATLPPTNTIPRMSQDHASMQAYYDQATEVFECLTLTDQAEVEFVNAFIKGFTSKKVKDKFLNLMQQLHTAKTKKDGLQILCDWEDVKEGLKKAKLFEEKQGSSNASKKRGGLNPRAFLETSFHL